VIYTFVLLDKPLSTDLRREVRPAHKAYLAEQAEHIAFAGPLVADDAETMIGSLLAIDFPNREAAAQWMREEPFNKSGLYASVQCVHRSRATTDHPAPAQIPIELEPRTPVMACSAVSSLEACATPALTSSSCIALRLSPGRYPTTLNRRGGHPARIPARP